MDVFDLMAKISLDMSGYEEGLKNAASSATSFASNVGGKVMGAAKVGAAAIGAVSAATTAIGGAFVKSAGDLASYGDNIDKMSQKMGMSAKAYQEWDAVMQHSGTSIDSMARGMTTLSKAAENNSDAFKALGISQEEIASMNQEELFARTIEGLQGMEAGTERTVLAQKLLGGAAKELGPLLNTTAEETQAMRDRVNELGGVMSDEAVKAAAAYQDQLQDMQTAFQGVSRGLMSEFLPSLTTVMSGLTEIFGGNGAEGVSLVKEGVDGIITGFTEAMPRVAEVGGQIFSALGQAITENIPAIIGAGTQIIINLGTGLITALPTVVDTVLLIGQTILETIIENAPQILEAGVELLSNLGEGITSGAPQAITALFGVLTRLVSYIMQNLPQFLSQGVAIIGKMAQGILNNLPAIMGAIGQGLAGLIAEIVKNLPQFLQQGVQLMVKVAAGIVQGIPKAIQSILSGISKMASEFTKKDWGSIGKDIMDGVANGIRNGLSGALNAMGEAAKGVLQKAKNALGIKSPSKVFRDVVGKNIGLGIEQGILDTIPLVNAAMDDLNDELVGAADGVDFGADSVVKVVDDGTAKAPNNQAFYNTWNVTVDGAENPEEWADRAVRELMLKARTA